MNRIFSRVLKGAACFGAIAACVVATPAKAAEVVVDVPHVRVVAPRPAFGVYAPPVVVERPVGFWYGGRWQGPIVRGGPGRFGGGYGWHGGGERGWGGGERGGRGWGGGGRGGFGGHGHFR